MTHSSGYTGEGDESGWIIPILVPWVSSSRSFYSDDISFLVSPTVDLECP